MIRRCPALRDQPVEQRRGGEVRRVHVLRPSTRLFGEVPKLGLEMLFEARELFRAEHGLVEQQVALLVEKRCLIGGESASHENLL